MSTPTEDELSDLNLACQKLWDLDENRLTPGEDYMINLGEGKSFYEKDDIADGKLFAGVKKEVWEKTTFLIFYHLLDNYERNTGVAEERNDREDKEVQDFLSAIMETPCMKYTHSYLVEKGVAPADESEFKDFLYQMWFYFYTREERNDTCGFEHVFVGESDEGKITGLHNWIQLYLEEARGNLDYMGFILPRSGDGGDPTGNERLITIQFGWDGEVKDVSSVFVGTSPEFELALYTLCFHAGSEQNRVRIDGIDTLIKCYRISSKYGDKVGSTFPQLAE